MTARRGERGITLTEVTVVFVLAALVMTGVVVFYLNSQTVWMDGSAQAITQREATLVLDAIAARAHAAESAVVSTDPGTGDVLVTLVMPGAPSDSNYGFRWTRATSTLEAGYTQLNLYLGPMTLSPVECFAAHGSDSLLVIDSLRVRSSRGVPVTMSTSVALMNRGAP